MSMHEVPDADLVELARADSTEAFRLLLERYYTLAFALALHFVAQPETAQDLVQEAMLQAYLSLDHLRDATRFKSWFYGIVLNVCRYWRRKQRTPPLSLEMWNEEQLAMRSVDPHALAEERELRCAVQEAVGHLSEKNRVVTFLFYYEDLSLEDIARLLNLSLAAVKSRLFQGRKQLQEQLKRLYPEFSPRLTSTRRRKTMTHVSMNLVQVVPVEQRLLVVLLDPSSQRVLTLWLHPLEGRALAILKGVVKEDAPKGAFEPSAYLEFVSDLFQATGATLQAVRLEELQERIFYAQVVVQSFNGPQHVKARLGDGLALAVRANAPLQVEDAVLARWGVDLPAAKSKTLEQRLNEVVTTVVAKTRPSAAPKLRRIAEPRNLQFAQGLERWELRGDFLLDASGLHWQDYTSGTDETGPQPGMKSGYLKALVPEPQSYADLRQAILAENYLGQHLRLSADIKTAGVEQEAGLYLRVIDPMASRPPQERQKVTYQGTQDWTRTEIQVEIPPDSVFILFGIGLMGKGQIWVTNVQLESIREP